MDPKSRPLQSAPEQLADINKKILEVKKKIQLSEGQRKALFEDTEAETKSNTEQISKLKKEISDLVVILHENKSLEAKYRIRNKALEIKIRPLSEKRCEEVEEMMDLQVIDRTKQTDLLRYKARLRRKYLADLAVRYQKLLQREDLKELKRKVEQPVKKITGDLCNNIHAMEVQIREAVHVRNRYCDIRSSLKQDADTFESRVKSVEEELEMQKHDIEKLQKVLLEATRSRDQCRQALSREERAANAAAARRESEAAQGRRLVGERRAELERLERRIFQGGRLPPRPQPEGAEEGEPPPPPPGTPPPPHPHHPVREAAERFEVLKRATGGTTTEEVLERFKSQKDTKQRMMVLRKKSEDEKQKLTKKLEYLRNKFESYKYAEVKEAEKKTGEMDKIQQRIKAANDEAQKYRDDQARQEEALRSLAEGLRGLYLCLNPLGMPDTRAIATLQKIKNELKIVMKKLEPERPHLEIKPEDLMLNIEEQEEKWLPGAYCSLIRATPVSQPGTSPAPPAPVSDDEEEVPSRGYLKRQAQLVIDAKLRRKNVGLQLPKR
ncbi:unnamed protein product [Callosobruchus maculatus]|uniref:Coiled-coil domain-containing protein 151 n=1 Tax=Callosobruchus maculatus TaxID=64391 RepID=A0A653DET2_CALMS|nr:unnamed protein product [Callosobruchus maculatus]